jgi:hypothetical protein
MEVPKKLIDQDDVIIDRIEDAGKKAFHQRRYQECLRQLVRELYASDKVNDILAKYKVQFLVESEPRVGLEFPVE